MAIVDLSQTDAASTEVLDRVLDTWAQTGAQADAMAKVLNPRVAAAWEALWAQTEVAVADPALDAWAQARANGEPIDGFKLNERQRQLSRYATGQDALLFGFPVHEAT